MFIGGVCSRFGVCLPSPRAIMALFCAVSPAWRLSWCVSGWIWLHGSTVSLAGGRESCGSATPRNAEPALVRAPPVHQPHDHGKAHTGTPSTQNHPNSPRNAHQAMPGAPIPWHRHPFLAIILAVPPSCKSCGCPLGSGAVPCCAVLAAGPGSSGCSAAPQGQAAIFLL